MQVQPKISYLIKTVCCSLAIIIMRLFYLQIHKMDVYVQQSEKNFKRLEKIISPRGNILDLNGNFLVTNRPTIQLYWYGSGNKKLTENQLQKIQTVSRVLEKNCDDQLLQAVQHTERFYKKLLLASDLPFKQLSMLEEQFPHDANIELVTNFKRHYPYQTYACHILGYLGNVDVQATGKMGLEQLLEDQLKGEPGSAMRTINSFGKNLSHCEIKKAFAGTTINTTLDIKLQTIAETIFPADLTGTAIVMDSADGSIRALVSRPNFDPSLFLEPIDHDDWKQLQDRQPFLNRAFNACYPPGSLFKLVSVSALLENRLISPDTVVTCCGYSTFRNRKYYCNKKTGHGELTACQAVAHSCNILFFENAKRIDIDVLASYAHKFGLGEKTNSLFSEKTGLIPSRAWKKKVKGERWWTGETLSASIGQSYLLVSPIQVARMISSIFTGYLVTPRFLIDEPIIKEPLDIQPNTRTFLKQSMKAVIKQGTGQSVSTIKDMIIYAKTSTAQTSALHKRELDKKYLEHGWFVAYVRYKQEAPLTLVFLVENVGSSSVAVQVAKDFLLEYKKLIDTQ